MRGRYIKPNGWSYLMVENPNQKGRSENKRKYWIWRSGGWASIRRSDPIQIQIPNLYFLFFIFYFVSL